MDTALPSTSRELWTLLTDMFPGFAEDCTHADISDEESQVSPSFHTVMIPFTQYLGESFASCTERQLTGLAAFINRAVTDDSILENAVSTCFLEHLHQIRAYKVLAPYLSADAKRRTHA